jgi:Protein of unknown function (DUF4007)
MRASFSGHETFPLRATWLKKAVDQVRSEPQIFSQSDSIADFGVGKNMVRAIRHWAVLSGVIELQNGSRTKYQITELGDLFFSDEGWDPFIEDPGTVWFLHWTIVTQIEKATLWAFLFGIYRAGSIDKDTFLPELSHWLRQQNIEIPSDSTLKRDFLCLGNSYAPQSYQRSVEDALQCPLSSLGLLIREDGVLFQSQRHKQQISSEIFGAIIIDYWSRLDSSSETLSIDQLLRENMSPGKTLFLSEGEAYERIMSLSDNSKVPFVFAESAGIRQLIRTKGDFSAIRLLNMHFANILAESVVYA